MHLRIFLAFSALALLGSCGSRQQAENYSSRTDTTAVTAPLQGENAPVKTAEKDVIQPEKKVILTADFNCNVSNVFTSVRALEALVKEQGGTIQESNMENTTGDVTSVEKGDSIIQYHTYHTVATLILRVPAAQFDTVVHAIPAMAQFIDTRKVRESDVTLQYYSNKLKAEANKERLNEMKGAHTDNKNGLAIAAYKDQKQEAEINHSINNMQLLADVSYATIAVKFTQPQEVLVQKVINPASLTTSSFSDDCRSALACSIAMLRYISLSLLTVWPLIGIIFGIVWIVKAYKVHMSKLNKI